MFAGFFAPGALGMAWYSQSADISATRTQCLARNSPQRCECIISVLTSERSIFSYIPIIRNVIEPSTARQQQLAQRAGRMC
jgi:hypothetical protein